MKTPIVVVIDMLQEVKRRQSLVDSINELLSITRSAACPVVWVRQEFEPDLRDAVPEMKTKGIHTTIKGTPGCQIISGLSRSLRQTLS